MEDSVLLSSLLNSVLQKSYGELTNLTELLPRKTDVDRKLEIVQYARHTRQLLIRILALVKWTKVSEPVHQCADVSAQINHHAWVFVDSADQLAHLSRNTLQQAGMPNFSLAPAIDVLTLGAYPRLPTCIRDRIIPPPTLSSIEKQNACCLLESIIRYRLSREVLPSTLRVTNISKGRVTLRVPYEFEAVLTVVGDDITLPWRLLELKVLVGEALSGSPVLVTQQQSYFLHQMVQSHLCVEDASLKEMFFLLHHFCLSLQLDRLHAQVERLSVAVCGIYIKIEEYLPGKHLKVGYWRNIGSGDYIGPPPSPFIPKEVFPSPKLLISINPHLSNKPFMTTHTPPLPTGDVTLSVHPHRLSFQELLVQCVRARSLALLKEYLELLKQTSWYQHTKLLQNPPCLRITLNTPLSSDTLLLSVDCRVGQMVASLESVSNPSEQVLKELQLMEQRVLINRVALPDLIGHLLSELYLTHITSLAKDYKLTVTRSLPLNVALPLEPLLLFINLETNTYLVANVTWENHTLQEKFFILRVIPCTILQNSLGAGEENIPKTFKKPVSLVEIGIDKVLTQLTGSLPVKKSSMKLKRKLQTQSHLMPVVKRLCVCPSSVLPSLPGLLSVTDRLSHIRTSLTQAGISALSISSGGLGAPHIDIYNMPYDGGMVGGGGDKGGGRKGNKGCLLSSLMCSYELWPHPDHVHSKLVFSDVLHQNQSSAIVIHTNLPYKDIGTRILRDWTDKNTLLALTIEIHSFLKQDRSELSKRCSIKSYTYKQLSLRYDEYILNINAVGNGVIIDCPAPSPHQYLSSTLQQFLQQTQSLPLLLKGICTTYSCLKDLALAFNYFNSTKLMGVAPSHIRLKRNLISLDIMLLCNDGVAFKGITWEKDTLPAIVTQPSVLIILRSFLSLQLQGKVPDNLRDEMHSLPLPSAKPSMLGPSPAPISSLPSIPSLPPPTNTQPFVGVVSTGLPEWEYTVSQSEWQKLLMPVDSSGVKLCVLEKFIGSLSLLVHWIKETAGDKYLHANISYISVDRGTFTYNVDVFSLSIGLDAASMSSLTLNIKTLQDGVWTEKEIQTLMEFFHKHVATPPFTPQALVAFLQLFLIPRKAMKSCIQIMQLQMQPSTDTVWRVNICLCVPNGIDLGDIARPGSAGIIYRGKILLFLNLTRQKDQAVLNLPILHDPKTNFNCVARKTSYPKQDVSQALQLIDQTLRKPSQDWNIPPSDSSLAYCIQHLLNVNLPI